MNSQLPLSLGLKDNAVFDNFYPGPNELAVSYLKGLKGGVQEPAVYLWGERGSGKSHLLQALCHAAGQRGSGAVYLPMVLVLDFPLEAMHGLERVALVCIDDVQLLAEQRDWQQALIGLFERIHDGGGSLVITADAAPNDLGLLPSLASRLAWGMAFHLQVLSDAGKIEALKLHSVRRGFELRDEVARHLVRHYGGDMTTLFATLDILDKASLAAKRKVSLAFARQVLKHDG